MPDLCCMHRWPRATTAVFPSPSNAEHRPRRRASMRPKAVGRIVEPCPAARVDPSRSRSSSVVLSVSLPASAIRRSSKLHRGTSLGSSPACGRQAQSSTLFRTGLR
ncbi:uncharacterized protein M6B38_163990 [Iris pallida]|uniref:Uncharacterized protein n=1 Tax=Iris pallida TaxID=29817 RepID=A0AAX6EYS3_IRIPA|nr:uncharacterized protein M6B38_163990 [Iris pallida]